MLVDPDGNIVWRQEDAKYLDGSLAAYEDGAFLAFQKSGPWTAAFLGSDGQFKWEYACTGSENNSLVVQPLGRDLFILHFNNHLVALNADGEEIYNTSLYGVFNYRYRYMAAAGDRVVLSEPSRLICFENGEMLWSVEDSAEYGSFRRVVTPSVEQVVVFHENYNISSLNVQLYCFDAATGVEQAHFPADSLGYMLALNQSQVLVSGWHEGFATLKCLTVPAGTELWKHKWAVSHYWPPHKGEIINQYGGFSGPVPASNGGVCLMRNGSLIYIGADGQQHWQLPATLYYEQFIEGHYSEAT